MEMPGPRSPTKTLLLGSYNQNTIDHRRKLLRRFYEPLLLLEALKRASQTRSRPEVDEPISNTTVGFRRSFADSIAYLCASERSSNNVTAVALARTPDGPVLWLATNDGVSDPTIVFLEAVLKELHLVAIREAPIDRQKMAEDISPRLLRQAISFGAPRLWKYINNIRNIELKSCTQYMRQNYAKDAKTMPRLLELCDWLEKTFLFEEVTVQQPHDLLHLALTCYVQRKNLLFEPLQLFSGQGSQHASDFARLFLLLCKIGKHITTTRKLVEATVHLCDDFREPILVRTVPSSPEKGFPLSPKEGSMESIIGRAFSSRQEMDNFKARLRSLWNVEEIGEVLSKGRPKKTRVHAELLLADHFYRNTLQFLDGHDRYIGCSKPTCYLCDAYLRNHPAAFAVPRSHQKIYLAWRCPDVPRGDANTYELHQEQEQMWLELIEWVRKDLKKEVDSRTPRAARPPDSTAGITSENHPPFAPFDLSKVLSMLQVGDDSRPNISSSDKDTSSQDKKVGRDTGFESDDEDGGVQLTR